MVKILWTVAAYCFITPSFAQLVKDDGTVQPMLLKEPTTTLIMPSAIAEDPDNGNMLLGGTSSETTNTAWLALAPFASSEDAQKFKWFFTFFGIQNPKLASVHFTPDVITSYGHKLGLFVFGS